MGKKDSSKATDTSKMPASVAGGREWADLGTTHFNSDNDSLLKQEAPSLVSKSPRELKIEFI